nr:protein quirky [Quercus suber]
MLVTLVGVRPYLSMCLSSIGTFTRRHRFYVWETCEWNLSFHLSLVGEGMLGSSKATSKRSLSVHFESSDDEVYPSGYVFVSDDQSSSEKELLADSPLEEDGIANPSGRGYRKIVLPRIWSVLKMEARKKKQVEIRKAATLRAQQLGGLLVSLAIVGQKRKQPMDKGQSSKKVQGPYDYLDQEEMVPTIPEPPRHGIERDQDFLLMWMHANTTNEDELDEEFDPLPSRKTGEVLKGRYDRLRIIAVRMQTVLGDLATQGERLQSLLSLYSRANASKTSCQLSSSSPKLLDEDVCKNW